MTGFSVGTTMSRPLRALFDRHAELGYDERNQANDGENLLRMLVKKVQYNEMVYMGVCGGACCAGKYYWCQSAGGGLAPGTESWGFDLFLGVSLRYSAGMKVEECDLGFIDENTFQLTGGAGLAVLITSEDVCASSFSTGKNSKWWEWCVRATVRHQEVVERIASRISGPWLYPGVSASGVWFFSLKDGVLVTRERLQP